MKRFKAKRYMDGWEVLDAKLSLRAEFSGPFSKQYAQAHARMLNEKEGKKS